MPRRLLLAAGGSSDPIITPPPDPDPEPIVPIPDDPMPYTLATSAPYNPPVPCQIDTYDGSGLTVHPTVWDFGPGNTWNGYRYWMCHTPYPFSDSALENPSIEASNNGWDWHTPAGLTNPIFPRPGTAYNSDPDFMWNTALNRMELIYRPMDNGEHIVRTWSTDGITWAPLTTIINSSSASGGCISPSIVPTPTGGWRIYARRDDRGMAYWSSTSLTGTWTGPEACNINAGGIPQTDSEHIWHLDALGPSAATGNRYLFLIATYPVTSLYAAWSSDGVNITVADDPVITIRPGQWDAGWLYRPTMFLHENGTHVRVWYSGQNSANESRTGYTQIPLTEWS